MRNYAKEDILNKLTELTLLQPIRYRILSDGNGVVESEILWREDCIELRDRLLEALKMATNFERNPASSDKDTCPKCGGTGVDQKATDEMRASGCSIDDKARVRCSLCNGEGWW